MLVIFMICILYKLNIISKEKFVVWLKRNIEKSGVLYVKIAQNISMMYDVIDTDVIEELKSLHSNVKVENVKFDIPGVEHGNVPFASGSIAQVYKGVYQGKCVAIKVLRPSVCKQIKSIKRLKIYLNAIGNVYKHYKSLIQRICDFIDNIVLQIDFQEEAKNMDLFREKIGNIVIIPDIYYDLSRKNILVMEYIEEKTSIYDVKDTPDSQHMISAIVNVSSLMAYALGIIHSDMHPGNIYWSKVHKKLIFFDFGLIYTFNEYICKKLIEMNINFILGRIKNVARNHLEITFKNYDSIINDEYFKLVLNVTEKVLSSTNPSLCLLRDISKINKKFKKNFSIINEGTTNYELFVNQVSQLIRILDPNKNFYTLAFKQSLNSTLQHLGKPDYETVDEAEQISLSI